MNEIILTIYESCYYVIDSIVIPAEPGEDALYKCEADE